MLPRRFARPFAAAFWFCEDLFDRIEVGAVGRKKEELAPAARVARRTAFALWLPGLSTRTMSRRHDDLFDVTISQETLAVYRPVDDTGSRDLIAAQNQNCQEGLRKCPPAPWPKACRYLGQTPAPRRAKIPGAEPKSRSAPLSACAPAHSSNAGARVPTTRPIARVVNGNRRQKFQECVGPHFDLPNVIAYLLARFEQVFRPALDGSLVIGHIRRTSHQVRPHSARYLTVRAVFCSHLDGRDSGGRPRLPTNPPPPTPPEFRRAT
jgi:hypothetical protein